MRTGSLVNHLMDQSGDAAKVEVGVGATMVMWSDRHAGTVVEVSRTGHRLVWQEDKATRTDSNGMSDAQSYSYERDPNGRAVVFTRRKDGSYRQTGGSARLLVGVRQSYHDYSF